MGRLDSPQILQRAVKAEGALYRNEVAFIPGVRRTDHGWGVWFEMMRFGSKQPKGFPIGYQGIMACHYRLDRRDGRCHLLDFNPSMEVQFRLLEGDNGIDVMCALHLDLTGRPLPAGHPVEGRTYMGDQHFLRC